MSDFYSAAYFLSTSRVAFKNMQVPFLINFKCLVVWVFIVMFFVCFYYHNSGRKRDWCFICKFEHLIRKGQESNAPLSPVGLLSHIQPIGREEDAHEFLRQVSDASFISLEISAMIKHTMTMLKSYQKCGRQNAVNMS